MISRNKRLLLLTVVLILGMYACAVYEESSFQPTLTSESTEESTEAPPTNQADESVRTPDSVHPSATLELVPTNTPVVDPRESELPVSPEKGALAPDFELDNLDGSRVFLREFRGRYVMINFWATWCGPCLIELPYFQESHEQYSPDLVILAVNDDETESEIRSYVDELGVTFRVLLDRGSKVQRLYRVRGLPTTFFLDPEGVIQQIHIGLITPTQLKDYLSNLGVAD